MEADAKVNEGQEILKDVIKTTSVSITGFC